jgi:hypothetical protein
MRMIDRKKTAVKSRQSEDRYVYNVKCAAKQLPIQMVLTFIVGIQIGRFVIRTDVGEYWHASTQKSR